MSHPDQIRLSSLMSGTSGRPEVVVGLVDGPIDFDHPALREARIRAARGAPEACSTTTASTACRVRGSIACAHGTFIAGMLCARRGSSAPAICPRCDFVARPIFHEGDSAGVPASTPQELAEALLEVIEAGARIVNLSVGIPRSSLLVFRELHEACDHARHRGVILVVAAGNQGRLGYEPLLAHPWILPVVACDGEGRPSPQSNGSPSIGRRGLMAPGDGVISTAAGGHYTRMSGTSCAAPWVSGAIALLWSEFPNMAAAEIRNAVLTAAAPRRSTLTPPLLNAQAAWELLSSRAVRSHP